MVTPFTDCLTSLPRIGPVHGPHGPKTKSTRSGTEQDVSSPVSHQGKMSCDSTFLRDMVRSSREPPLSHK